MAHELPQSQVIHIIEQYLLENGLHESYRALAKESKVQVCSVCANLSAVPADASAAQAQPIPIPDLLQQLFDAISKGQWDTVVKLVSTQLVVPDARVLIDTYELMVLELIELQEIETAQMLLNHTAPLIFLKQVDASRHSHLMRLASARQQTQTAAQLYGEGITKENRREQVIKGLKKQLKIMQPSRLLAMIGTALRTDGQQFLSTLRPVSLGESSKSLENIVSTDDSQVVSECVRTIKFGKNSAAEAAAFSSNGKWIVTGSSDGFVEVFDWQTGQLDTSLDYQAKDQIMLHDSAVLSVAVSKDCTMIASGDTHGTIKVWHVARGTCLRKFTKAHSGAVSCLQFTEDGTQLLSGSQDCNIKIFGLQSESVLKTFHGHTSYVTSVCFNADESRIISSGKDGFVRIWNAKTMECLRHFAPSAVALGDSAGTAAKLAHTQAASARSIHSVHLLPTNPDIIVVCADSPSVFLTRFDGTLVKHISIEATTTKESNDIECCAVSASGKWIYAVSYNGNMYALDVSTGSTSKVYYDVHRKLVHGVACHPSAGVVATYSADGKLKLWM